jgi:hypothetical protein
VFRRALTLLPRRAQSLTYSVPSNTQKGEQAVLLNDVSGFFEPSAMTALARRFSHRTQRLASRADARRRRLRMPADGP